MSPPSLFGAASAGPIDAPTLKLHIRHPFAAELRECREDFAETMRLARNFTLAGENK
jgi:hypothetical protein